MGPALVSSLWWAANHHQRAATRFKQTKIVGGEQADLNEFPFMAALALYHPDTNKTAEPDFADSNQFCGGSLISSRHVLTAAHCVTWIHQSSVLEGILHVHLGDHDLAGEDDTEHVVKIAKGIVYPAYYKGASKGHDIAVILLDSDVTLTEKIQTIKLPKGKFEPGWRDWLNTLFGSGPIDYVVIGEYSVTENEKENEDLSNVDNDYVGNVATVAGWGTTQYKGNSSSTLIAADLTVISNSECQEDYNTTITEDMVCAKSPGKDSCQGDSGGPLFTCSGQLGDRCTQIGVVSWGAGCANEKFAGVYSRLDKLMHWINRVVPNL
jgi:secreted trypsin-like serine protease